MEILQNIWTALTSENEMLAKFILIPTIFIESIIHTLLFTTIFNIQAQKAQKIRCIIFNGLACAISAVFIPQPYNTYVNMITIPLFIFFCLKISLFQSILCAILPFAITGIIESIIVAFALHTFSLPAITLTSIPIYRLAIVLLVHFFDFCIYFLVKHVKFNISQLDSLPKKNKILFFINFIIAIIIIAIQFYLLYLYSDLLPSIILLFSILMLISYLCISIYSLLETSKRYSTIRDLEEAQLYNKTLTILHDNIRAFKHDFNNIVQSIGGYIATEDIPGLKKFYSELLNDCQTSNTLNVLSPKVINDPAIYSLITSKYYKAAELGIKMNLEIFLDLTTLNMKIYEFTRIFGILLDNAIEATSECDEKEIFIIIQKDPSRPRQLAIVKNTYKDKQIDTEKIYEKGYSTKPNNTGLGLWKVRQILKSNENLNLYTSKDTKYFSQQLEIYL